MTSRNYMNRNYNVRGSDMNGSHYPQARGNAAMHSNFPPHPFIQPNSGYQYNIYPNDRTPPMPVLAQQYPQQYMMYGQFGQTYAMPMYSVPRQPIHQHSAQSSPTSQQVPQEPIQQMPPPQTIYKPSKRPNAIIIKDPNSGKVIERDDLNKDPKEIPVGPEKPVLSEQEVQTKKSFKDQVASRVHGNSQSESQPSSPKQSISKKVEKPAIEKPTVDKKDTAVSPLQPTIILQNNRSQTDMNKTPEKTEAKEISIQTTPSLKANKLPAASPPQPAAVSESSTETDGSPKSNQIMNIPTPKLQGETIIIDNNNIQKNAKDDVKQKSVKDDGKQKNVKDDGKQKSVKEDVKQKNVKEDVKQKSVKDDAKQKNVKEDAKPKNVMEDVKPKNAKEDVKPKNVKEDAKPKNVKEDIKPKNVKEDIKPKNVKEDVKPKNVKEDVKPKNVKEDAKPKNVKEDVKVNGLKEKPEPVQDDIQSSEESSECKEQFMTPPATPSEVKPDKPPPKPEEIKKVVEASNEVEVTAKATPEINIEFEDISSDEEEFVPVVPEKTGPYRYTKEEMLPLREAQDQLPPNLPKLDCIMDKPQLKMEATRATNRSNNQFVPDWERSKNRSQHRNRSMDKNYMNKPRIIEHVMQIPQSRKKSQNAWLSKREGGEEKETDEIKLLKGQVTAILNKITPQNFKDLSVQILQFKIDTMIKLEIAVEIIFEKAILEPAFSQTYANLCKVMSSIKIPEEQNDKVSPFRKTLLNRCQKEFFREKDDEKIIDDKIKLIQEDKTLTEQKKQDELEELYYQRSKLKKKMLGNINFIGELYNLNMISAKIIQMQCITNLVEKKKLGTLDDESIECLAKLFTTVGSKLEMDTSHDENKKTMFEDSYKAFKDLATDKNYPYRIRFMIQDVVDLRDNGWKPRRQEAKPQRIEDIHREHALEEQERKMEAAVAQQQSRKVSKRNDSMRGSRDGREKDWPKKVNTNFDMNKLTNQKLDSVNIVLGPSRQAWGRGSGTGSGTNSPIGSTENLASLKNDVFKNKTLLPGKTTSAPGPRAQAAERQATIAKVRDFRSPKRTASPSPVRNAENKDKLTDEQIVNKTKSILMEYFDIDEIEEAVDCIKDEMGLVKKHHVFIEESLNIILETKPKNVAMLADLYVALFEQDPPLIHADALLTGFQKAFEQAEDLAIDVPGVYKIFGQLLGKCVATDHLSLKIVIDALPPLESAKKVGKVMCETLKTAIEALGSNGENAIQQMWAKEKLNWKDICDDHASLIKEYQFEFLSSSPLPTVLSGIEFQNRLSELLTERSKVDTIFDFVDNCTNESKRQSPEFIKELMTAVCQCVFIGEIEEKRFGDVKNHFTNYVPVLKKYIQAGDPKHNKELELHALDALQFHIFNLGHPRGLAYFVCDLLDETNIISPDGFKHWSVNGQELQGWGVIRQNLKQFLTEIESNDGEDSDNQ